MAALSNGESDSEGETLMVRTATDTRERVLTTARNLFSSHGYNGTSLQDILGAVGITKGAFYHYFKSKEALCEIILEEAIEEYHHLAEAIQDDIADPESLKRWLTLIIQQNTAGQWLNCRLLTRLTIECAEMNPMMQNRLRTFWRWYQSFYETLIRRSQSADDIEDDDTSVLARSLICCLFGAIWLDRCLSTKDDLSRVAEVQLRQLLHQR
jgi:AcrR family transcriptional regulator